MSQYFVEVKETAHSIFSSNIIEFEINKHIQKYQNILIGADDINKLIKDVEAICDKANSNYPSFEKCKVTATGCLEELIVISIKRKVDIDMCSAQFRLTKIQQLN